MPKSRVTLVQVASWFAPKRLSNLPWSLFRSPVTFVNFSVQYLFRVPCDLSGIYSYSLDSLCTLCYEMDVRWTLDWSLHVKNVWNLLLNFSRSSSCRKRFSAIFNDYSLTIGNEKAGLGAVNSVQNMEHLLRCTHNNTKLQLGCLPNTSCNMFQELTTSSVNAKQ